MGACSGRCKPNHAVRCTSPHTSPSTSLASTNRDGLHFVALYMKGLIERLVCNVLQELSHLEYPTSGDSFQTNCIPVKHATSWRV